MSQTGGGGGQPTQGGYATRPGPRHNQQHHGHQQPNPAAAWGAPTADPYAAAAYQQQQAAAAAAYAGYGYQMKDVSVAGGYGAMPQVQGYYVPAGVAQQTMGGWDGFGGFGYAAQPSTAAAQYAAAGAYGQPGYGLYGSAFGPVYGQPQQQQMMAQQYQQQQQQQQQVQQAQQGQRGAAGQQNAIGYKAAVGGAIGSKPSLAVASTADQQKTSPVLANSGIAGANGEATDVEIVGGYGPGTVPGGGADKLSASNSVASELGKDVYEQAAGAGTATTTANKSPFGPGMFFGAIGSYEGLDGTGGAVPPEDETEWRDYEARFGIDDLLGGLGGSGSAPVNVTTGAGTVAMPASAPLTSGPPPGLGPIARNGSIGEIANGGGSAISPVGAAAAAANSGDAFQFPSWGTSIGALGGMLGDAGAQTSFGSVGSAGQSDLVASVVQNLAGGLAQLGLQEHEDTVASTTTETAVGTTASEREPSPAPSNEDSNATPPEPAAPGVKKPMSWAAIAKTPAKPAEVKPVVAPAAVKPPGIAPAIPITANGRAPVGAVATTGSWAAMAKAAGPVAPAAPKRIITGGGADDPKSRTNEMFAERGINPKNFNIKPNNARYFVIKSYTEDDVHKSLKYSIWASTEIGNRRLDAAFVENNSQGPIYLFYSVNASGHFCGVAEMLTRVDWNKNSSVWAQDGKWKGMFAVKWVFVKDVPNGALRHLKVQSNENKPVTNSRDTQELPPDVGREMLRIFNEYRSRTCIMDDWNWYDEREVSRQTKTEPSADEENNSPVSGATANENGTPAAVVAQ